MRRAFGFGLLAILAIAAGAQAAPPEGWREAAARDEIRPSFSIDPGGGPRGEGSLVIRHDNREGLDGWYERTFPVEGGRFYHFGAIRKTIGVVVPRRSALVRLLWRDSEGRPVAAEVPEEQVRELGHTPSAEPDYPLDEATDAAGWTTVQGVYKAPPKAGQVKVELHLAWAPGGEIQWSDVQLEAIERPAPRRVRLATIHHRPPGGSAAANNASYGPLLEEASRQRADLVVLGETVPSFGLNRRPEENAEPIPGPTTEFYSNQAKRLKLHIVLSLHERDGHLVHNTAVLIGPDGAIIGKYRKVCLPPDEAAAGVAPGTEYPVFDTAIGKIGLMVCYDGFFPEVARELSNRGAEIIAWPVYGCNTLLAQARACENHVYLISSTYMAPEEHWMISAIFDRTGRPIQRASQWDTVVVAEVDLSRPYIGPYNLGDFRSMLPRHRPVARAEGAESEPAPGGH